MRAADKYHSPDQRFAGIGTSGDFSGLEMLQILGLD